MGNPQQKCRTDGQTCIFSSLLVGDLSSGDHRVLIYFFLLSCKEIISLLNLDYKLFYFVIIIYIFFVAWALFFTTPCTYKRHHYTLPGVSKSISNSIIYYQSQSYVYKFLWLSSEVFHEYFIFHKQCTQAGSLKVGLRIGCMDAELSWLFQIEHKSRFEKKSNT